MCLKLCLENHQINHSILIADWKYADLIPRFIILSNCHLSENPAPSRNEPVTLNGRLCVNTLRSQKKPRRMRRKRLTMFGECKKSLNLHYSYCTSSLDIIQGIEDGHEDN